MIALPKCIHFAGRRFLPLLMASVLLIPYNVAFAGDGSNTNLPFSDDFEAYPALTSLINGTNGWFGDFSNIIVQTAVVRGGTNAAVIPVDCTLSNRFVDIPVTNIWIQMDTRPVLYDGTNHPLVDTNQAGMFYINTSGYFVVHNGIPTNSDEVIDPTNSVNWVKVDSVDPIATNGTTWVRLNIYQNFAATNWAIYADGVLVTNNIGFIKPDLTTFGGFDIYNGATTSYLDNVFVTAIATNEATQRPLIIVPPDPAVRNIFFGETPSVQTMKVYNIWDEDIGFEIETNREWIAVGSTNGNVEAGTTTEVSLTYADTSAWPAGSVSNAVVTVVATNGADRWNTQSVVLVVNVMELDVTPAILNNPGWVGQNPTSQTVEVRNAGAGSFSWTASITNQEWLSCSTTSGVLGAGESSTLTLTYNTAGWGAACESNTIITIASPDSGGAQETVSVTVVIEDVVSAFQVAPDSFTNWVWIGDKPASQVFVVSNIGGASLAWSAVVTNQDWVSCSQTDGVLNASESVVVTLSYSNTAGWPAGQSNTILLVATTNGAGANVPVSVELNAVEFEAGVLRVEPSTLMNTVGRGDTPADRTFDVINTGIVTLAYTVGITGDWVSCSAGSGSIAPQSSNTLTLSFIGTETWPVGPPNSNTTVRIVTVNGSGATGDVAVTLQVLDSGITNIIPYTDNFAAYSDQMPLVGGVSGWYASASSVIVQDEIKSSGTNAALVPIDCTLSNRFVAGTPMNVRIAMDVRLVRTDFAETNFPAVDSNAVVQCYVDTNGHFVVCSGSAETSTWCMVSNAVGSGTEFVVANDTWTSIVIYLNYRHRNWKLKANGILITNRIGFISQQTNGFRGFDIYSGNSTSYLDNVAVNWWDRFKVNGVLDHLINVVDGVVPDRILGVLTNDLPAP